MKLEPSVLFVTSKDGGTWSILYVRPADGDASSRGSKLDAGSSFARKSLTRDRAPSAPTTSGVRRVVAPHVMSTAPSSAAHRLSTDTPKRRSAPSSAARSASAASSDARGIQTACAAPGRASTGFVGKMPFSSG